MRDLKLICSLVSSPLHVVRDSIFEKCIFEKCIFEKCIFEKCIFRKYIIFAFFAGRLRALGGGAAAAPLAPRRRPRPSGPRPRMGLFT